ncbi:hypothetical protein BpHYR1_027821 [Brachionus plicatilis]|uniref:Uncharacterized protein n=1 Tax=Brachionus plicatilis TaxID=10195 RepID=A0A3M7PFV2_BRAPC|nr:hypothetical protein BpHYR1_027821 [Brachionus plicatilis]
MESDITKISPNISKNKYIKYILAIYRQNQTIQIIFLKINLKDYDLNFQHYVKLGLVMSFF